ncbi:MAG: hypothetical protein ACI4J8_00850 [Oscillospiraceae bacterium]
MNKGYSIEELMSLYYEKEFAAAEEAELPEFSAKHKRKMQKIFNLFDNKARMNNSQMALSPTKQLSLKKRLLFDVIIVVGLALTAGCANALISQSFPETIYSDNTNIFWYNGYVPDGYVLYTAQVGDKKVTTAVKDDVNIELAFPQSDTKISDCGAVCVSFNAENYAEAKQTYLEVNSENCGL